MNNSIKLKSLISAFMKHIVWLVMVPLVCACLMFAVSSFEKSTYSTTVVCYSKNSTTEVDFVSSQIIAAQQAKIKDYINILKSDATLQRVAQNISTKYGVSVSLSELKGMISATHTEDTAEFRIHITAADAKTAECIAKSISQVYPPIVEEIDAHENLIEILSKDFKAVENKPDFIKPSLLAAMIGFVVTFAVCFLLAYNDKTIRSKEEAEDMLGIPVIGIVPRWKKD